MVPGLQRGCENLLDSSYRKIQGLRCWFGLTVAFCTFQSGETGQSWTLERHVSVCLLPAVYEWSLPTEGCSCVFLAWMCGFRDALKKSSQNAIFKIVILAIYEMIHSCDDCLLMVNPPLKGNNLHHRYLFQTILSHPEVTPIQSGRFPLKPFLIFGKNSTKAEEWDHRFTLLFNITLVNTRPW